MEVTIKTLQEALGFLASSDLYDTKRHLYYCVTNRITAAIDDLASIAATSNKGA